MTLLDINGKIHEILAKAKADLKALIAEMAASIRDRGLAGEIKVLVNQAEVDVSAIGEKTVEELVKIAQALQAEFVAAAPAVEKKAEGVVQAVEKTVEEGVQLLKDAAGLASEAAQGKLN